MSAQHTSKFDEIRRKAEQIAQERPLVLAPEKAEEYQALIHELHVHQIELEIQNDELRSAQRDLEITRNRYADLFNNAPVGYLILDRSGLIQTVNQTFADMVGQDPSHLINRPFGDYLTDSARHIFLSRYSAFFNQPNAKRIDVQLKTNQTHNITIMLHGSREIVDTTSDKAMVYDRIRIVAINISEQRDAEIALAESHAELRLQHSIAEVMLRTTDEEMFAEVLDIILEHFHATFGYFGYINEKGDLVCPSMTKGVFPTNDIEKKDTVFSRSDWGGLWGRSLIEKRTLYQNADLQLPEGHIPLSNALAVPLLHRNDLIGQIVIADKAGGFDTDDEKRLEAIAAWIAPVLSARVERDRQQARRIKAENNLLQAQRMESIGVLAGGVAHDFNNLLTPIIGYTDMMIEGRHSEHPELKSLQEISRAAHRAKDLVNQLLAYSRKQMLNVKPLDVNSVIENISSMIDRLMRDNIEVEYALERDVGIIKADAGQIDQILMNLAVNAQDAMPKGGRLHIQTLKEWYPKPLERHPFDIKPDRYIVIRVSDTGTGISDDVMPYIFEPFFTTKDVGQGTGMGLATCYGIVKQHDGYIWAESRPGQGTTFIILFPSVVVREVPHEQSEDQDPNRLIRSHGETVMVVEDDPAVRKMAVMTLRRLGYRVFEAETSESCLDRVASENLHIDLLLSDVVMPGSNGAELYQTLKTTMPKLKGLFMSGYTDDILNDHGLADAGAGFIGKPFSISELSIKVREVLDEQHSKGDH